MSDVREPREAGAAESPTAMSVPGVAAPAGPRDELVERFLSDRDVPCPSCGYNLRGSRATACPECGKSLRLALVPTKRLAGYGLFVLLALAWVFLASGMNATRQFRSAYAIAQSATQRGLFSWSVTTTTINGRTTTTTRSSPSNPTPVPLTVPGMPQQIIMTPGPQGTMTFQTGPGATGPVRPAWNAVPASQWWTLGWWGGLALTALLGLLAMAVMRLRSREWSPAATRGMVGLASLLFVLYSGYHVQLFAREMFWW
ncbi:MAG: hypothetical protein AB7K52_09480 [Phycisphaerales bacterium]